MRVISESVAATLLSAAEAIPAIESAFLALATGRAAVFPVVLCTLDSRGSRFGVKAGILDTPAGRFAGPKIGGYWPGNADRGLPNHTSTVLLLDAGTGAPEALVGAGHLTALRTAAADALAVKYLARPGPVDLAVLGAGHQAYFDVLAIAQVRSVSRVRVWSRSPDRAKLLAERLGREGFEACSADVEAAVRAADVIVTATTSQAPLFEPDWVKPGCHLSAMGADAPGKQELPATLVLNSVLFADSLSQSITIGEFQTAVRIDRSVQSRITPLGDVIAGLAGGRTSGEEITVFDSSGLAIQDLAICALALERARACGAGVEVSW